MKVLHSLRRIRIASGGAAGGDLPKPMVPVGGKPIVWHIMRGFAHWGFRDFVLCLGYRTDLFKQYFLNLSTMLNDVTIEPRPAARSRSLHQRGPEADWTITLAETGMDSHDRRARQTRRRVRAGRTTTSSRSPTATA